MNALSRLWLNDALLLALRMVEQKSLKWDDDKLCADLGEKLRHTYVASMHKYTKEPLEKCERFSLNAHINWKRMARQMMFWLDASENGYPKYLALNKIPEKIYGKKTIVSCHSETYQNFKNGRFSNNGVDIDIGGFNGALGWTEMEKAWMIFSLWCIALAEGNSLRGPS